MQPFLGIQSPQLLMVHADPLAIQQQLQPSPAKAATFRRQFLQPLAWRRIIAATMAIARGAAIDAKDRTVPPLADAVRFSRGTHRGSPSGGRHHFLDVISFSTALSSMASANSFFSLAFSSSSCFSRFASETLIPPNFAFQA